VLILGCFVKCCSKPMLAVTIYTVIYFTVLSFLIGIGGFCTHVSIHKKDRYTFGWTFFCGWFVLIAAWTMLVVLKLLH